MSHENTFHFGNVNVQSSSLMVPTIPVSFCTSCGTLQILHFNYHNNKNKVLWARDSHISLTLSPLVVPDPSLHGHLYSSFYLEQFAKWVLLPSSYNYLCSACCILPSFLPLSKQTYSSLFWVNIT